MAQEDSTTLEDAIESVIQRVLYNEVSTFFPAKITKVKKSKVNPNTVVVDVVSAFLKINPEDNSESQRAIQSVPLMTPGRTNTFILRPPTDEASLIDAWVGLHICNNYLANWKKTGGNVLPTDGRKFHYADAVAVLGLYPDLKSWSTPPKKNTAQMKVAPDTFLEIGNNKTDIPRLIADVMDIFSNAKSATGVAGGSLILLPSTISLKTLPELIAEFASLFNPDDTP